MAPALGAACPASALAGPTQVSIFQDDAHLVYGSPHTVRATLAALAELGVDQVRATLKWADVAPDPGSTTTPPGFGPDSTAAANPVVYAPQAWAPYDQLVRDAAAAGIQVEFNLSAPGPLWAMAPHAAAAKAADHNAPNARQFEAFVEAAGLRYSGRYAGLPRVSHWSVWNEPNQPGWLAPQWRQVGGHWVPNSPRLYRGYVLAAYVGLYFSGHLPGDQFLIGETAPSGYAAQGALVAMKPLVFLRALYCVDSRFRPLVGAGASALGCPTTGRAAHFGSVYFPLFTATGFAHHPYSFTTPPWQGSSDPDVAPLADLGRLERMLDRAFAAWGVRLRLPIYLTEYGYETDPPDPHRPVTPAEQATYLNAADHMAWSDPRVRSVAQFLLRDAPPDPRYRPNQYGYWDTFQTGLEFASGRAKPALGAYRLPIWVSGRIVWGQVRSASRLGDQTALVQFAPTAGGAFHTLVAERTSAAGFLLVRVRPPRTGFVRIAWRGPDGRLYAGRAAAIG